MRQPTPKQWRFIAVYISNGGNATRAALEAYDTNDYYTAKSIGCENLTKPYIRQEIEKRMSNVKLTIEDAIRTIKEALEASGNRGPDWTARLKAADMTLKLADAYPKEGKAMDESNWSAEQGAFADTPTCSLHFALAFDQLPTEAQEAFMLGDDSKWEKARQEGEHLVGEEPIELMLYKGRYERSELSEEEREALLKGELPK